MNLEVLHQEPVTNTSGEHLPHIVFIHGGGHAAWVWADNFLPWFAAYGFHAIAPSLRGHGGSAERERMLWHRMRDYVADVAQVVRMWVGDQPFVLVGHSVGGAVVQRYLADPELPQPIGAVLLNTTNAPGWREGLRPSGLYFRHPMNLLKSLIHLDLCYLAGKNPELTREFFFTPHTPAEIVKRCCDRLQGGSLLVLLWDLLRYQPGKTHIPIYAIGSKEDALIAPALVQSLADAYRSCGTPTCFQLFEHMGHDTMLDCGWQDVAETIAEFARNCGKVPAR